MELEMNIAALSKKPPPFPRIIFMWLYGGGGMQGVMQIVRTSIWKSFILIEFGMRDRYKTQPHTISAISRL